jgi:hypothetical protein
MNRRDALRLLAGGAALPLVPQSLLALREARAVLDSTGAPRTLNPHQNLTVSAIAEMIIPKTDTPGATDVGTAQFIDLMLTEWYDQADRDRFLRGLDEVDARTRSLFSKDLIACSSAQKAEVMAWMGERIAQELDQEREHEQANLDDTGTREVPESFGLMMRRLTLTAYYTSEAGATDELHFEMIPDRFDGCAKVQSEQVGSARQ